MIDRHKDERVLTYIHRGRQAFTQIYRAMHVLTDRHGGEQALRAVTEIETFSRTYTQNIEGKVLRELQALTDSNGCEKILMGRYIHL